MKKSPEEPLTMPLHRLCVTSIGRLDGATYLDYIASRSCGSLSRLASNQKALRRHANLSSPSNRGFLGLAQWLLEFV